MSDQEHEDVLAPLPESQSSVGKRLRADDETDSDPEANIESQMSEKSMDGQLTCGVCLSVLSNPFTIIPCMHTFDRSCLTEWWRKNANCPMCKQKSISAKFAFQIDNIIGHYHKRKRHAPDPENSSREEIFPFGRRALAPLPSESSVGGSQFGGLMIFDQEDDDDEEDAYSNLSLPGPLPDPRPGGNLVWPCPSCDPDNNTGYVCPLPIPMPTSEQIAEEQANLRPNGPPIRAPLHGERRMPLHFARGTNIPGAEEHEVCAGCDCYLPKDWAPQSAVRCGECRAYYCNNYDPNGCPSGPGLRPRNRLSLPQMTTVGLWGYMPIHLRGNNHERTVFEDYLRDQLDFTVDQVLEKLADAKLEAMRREARDALPAAQGDEEPLEPDYAYAEERWGNGVWLCENGIWLLLEDQLWNWWRDERAKNLVPVNIRSLPDCWYGRECRTQSHRNGHASTYNERIMTHVYITSLTGGDQTFTMAYAANLAFAGSRLSTFSASSHSSLDLVPSGMSTPTSGTSRFSLAGGPPGGTSNASLPTLTSAAKVMQTSSTKGAVARVNAIYDRNLNKTRNVEVSASAFAFMFSEAIQYTQKRVSGIGDLERRLNTLGYRVGGRMVELMSWRAESGSKAPKREIRFLPALLWIHTHLWRAVFGKPADAIEKSVENDDEYMIIDNDPPITRGISIPKEMSQLSCSAFSAGIVEAVLDGLVFPARVTAHSVPNDQFPARTTILIKLDRSVVEREEALK